MTVLRYSIQKVVTKNKGKYGWESLKETLQHSKDGKFKPKGPSSKDNITEIIYGLKFDDRDSFKPDLGRPKQIPLSWKAFIERNRPTSLSVSLETKYEIISEESRW